MADIAEQGPLPKMSGYLMKKSTAGDWQKRYFETNGSFLTYYKSQKMSKLLAALSLPQVGDIGEISSGEKGEKSTFQLDLKDRQYILKADSQEQARAWVDTLVFLRDGGGVKTAQTTPVKSGDDVLPPQEDPDDGVAVYPSPKRTAAEGPNAGSFVKAGSADQCAASCSIA